MDSADSKKTVELLAALEKALTPADRAPLLIRLLLDHGHQQHEDFVFELGLIGDPRAVQTIAEAIVVPFEHLIQWNNLQAFQRKCAYALARIGTADSRLVLQGLSQSSDLHIREFGQEGLDHWPMPYKAR